MGNLLEFIKSLSGTFLSVIFIIALYSFFKWSFKFDKQNKHIGEFLKQVIFILIVFIGVIMIVISLPINDSTKGQIIGLIGIVLSAAFALSSTTLLGNALAGFMNRNIKNFKLGDFIKTEDNFGRVTEIGLFHTEIQIEDRGLITLPNLYLSTNPVKVFIKSGIIVSSICSLGYDVHRKKVEKCLLEAANNAGLKDPFVYVMELGDFSIVYKVHGLLENTEKYFTVKSKLNSMVLDSLHDAKIEIVSPGFVNQRQVNDITYIPREEKKEELINEELENTPENMIFDKAIEAEKLEIKQDVLNKIEDKIENMKEKLKEEVNEDLKNETKEKINKLKQIHKETEEKIIDKKNELEE